MDSKKHLCLVFDGTLYYSGCFIRVSESALVFTGIYSDTIPLSNICQADKASRFWFKTRGIKILYRDNHNHKKEIWIKVRSKKICQQILILLSKA